MSFSLDKFNPDAYPFVDWLDMPCSNPLNQREYICRNLTDYSKRNPMIFYIRTKIKAKTTLYKEEQYVYHLPKYIDCFEGFIFDKVWPEYMIIDTMFYSHGNMATKFEIHNTNFLPANFYILPKHAELAEIVFIFPRELQFEVVCGIFNRKDVLYPTRQLFINHGKKYEIRYAYGFPVIDKKEDKQ